ncbi:BLUF domain-containing protein [Rhodoplanes sp. TEM]|uniref:BLUF domain-containing protein n=1 Tax=Rhodoplanes tepidamans TaxID=200616 RepID=A0ABT5JBZ4_RHOTP|nr:MULTISPECIES: BLUF domain-containing protein [Rhodoplanes]MDC7787200.1 BLUF domain-containing protein [Rhodoplanes tepidamans]MDC7984236.1 BLUF domain-containing protein [Rhodoplanes sp. TEM]MDQ0356033.1 methylmalonyl-CoA mutase cobalamin-binding subunit [Rhodoplanes tepidamans]
MPTDTTDSTEGPGARAPDPRGSGAPGTGAGRPRAEGPRAEDALAPLHPTAEPEPPPPGALLSLAFRTRAAAADATALQAGLAATGERLRGLGIGGLLLHDRGTVFHWLEGPPDAVRAIWRAARTDPRLAAAELLGESPTPVRMFGDLQILGRGADAPEAGGSDLDAIVADLAACAMAGAGRAVESLLDGELRAGRDLRTLRGAIIEPAARRIGDWREADHCCDMETTLALAHLQQGARRLGAAVPPDGSPAAAARTALVAAHRAEPSVLGVTLVGDVFRDAGWCVEVAFPHDAADLCAAVRAEPCDVLVLLLGDIARHPAALDGVAAHIRAARAAAGARDLVVLVGGRIALDRPDSLAAIVGADAAFTTAPDAIEKAADLLGRRAARQSPAGRPAGRSETEPPRRPAEIPPGWFWVR